MLSTILNISILHANVSDSLMDVFKVGNFKVFKVGNFKVFKVLKLEKEHSCTVKNGQRPNSVGVRKSQPAHCMVLQKLCIYLNWTVSNVAFFTVWPLLTGLLTVPLTGHGVGRYRGV
jgi:hypothetical protein